MKWKHLFRSKEKGLRAEALQQYDELRRRIMNVDSRTAFDKLVPVIGEFNSVILSRYQARVRTLTEFWFVFYLTKCMLLSSMWSTYYFITLFDYDFEKGVFNPNEKYYL